MRIIYIAFLAVSIFLVGCSPKVDTRTIDGLMEHFRNSGLVITGKTEQMAEVIGAIGAAEGTGVGVYGQSIAIYRFDTTNTAQSQSLEKITKAGIVTILGSIALPAQTNGSFIITGYQDHPEKQKILDAFKSWSKDSDQKSATGAKQTSSNQDTELITALNGVWKPNDDSGLFKFSLSTQQKIVSVIDGDKTTNIAVKVASVDSRNHILNLQYESDPKRTITLKQDFMSGSSTKFNLLLTLSDGQTGSLAFVRNIDSSDDLKVVNNSNPSQPEPKRDFLAEATQDIKFVNPSPAVLLPIDFSTFKNKHPSSIASSEQLDQTFRRLMGKDFEEFLDNIQVASDVVINHNGKEMFGIGMAPHSGGEQAGAYVVDQSGHLYAVLVDMSAQPKFRIYGAADYGALPIKLREFISKNRT